MKADADPLSVSDALWEKVSALLPERDRSTDNCSTRRPSVGRPAKPSRLVFEAIVFVLRTGCQWKALSRSRFGSSSAVHQRFVEWSRAGFFEKIWQAGLAEYEELEGIAWKWQRSEVDERKALWELPAPIVVQPMSEEACWGTFPAVITRVWSPVVAHRQRHPQPKPKADKSPPSNG